MSTGNLLTEGTLPDAVTPPDADSPETDTSMRSLANSTVEMLFDIQEEGEQSLNSFTRNFCVKDIYTIFSEYVQSIRGNDVDLQPVFYNKKYEHLNRYVDVPCFDNTRVAVKHLSGMHDYIHANYVDGFREKHKFILTQAPMAIALEHFWKMVWDEKSVMIVSLTPIDGVRCPDYFPIDPTQSMSFGSFVVTHEGTRHVRNSYDATLLSLQKEGESSSRTLLQLTFYRWPGKGTPTSPTEVLNFIEDINFNRKLLIGEAIKDGWLLKETDTSPIIVHCVAGVGRSGTLVVLDICQRKLDVSSKLPIGPVLNVQEVVSCVCLQRALAVQKPEQYLFIHFAMLEYALRKRYYKTTGYIDLSNFMQV